MKLDFLVDLKLIMWKTSFECLKMIEYDIKCFLFSILDHLIHI